MQRAVVIEGARSGPGSPSRKPLQLGSLVRAALILALLGSTEEARAGRIFLSGDSTPVFSLTDLELDPATAGNQQFFANVLGDGSSVTVLMVEEEFQLFTGAAEVQAFYSTLPGVSSGLLLEEFFGASSLAGVDLFVVPFPSLDFTPDQIAAMATLLAQGGSLFFLGDSSLVTGGSATNEIINDALSALGVPMSLDDNSFDAGPQVAVGGQIASHPLTAGVAEFTYGAASSVTGGVPLFYTQGLDPFVAVVPEPGKPMLLSCGVLGLVAFGRSRRLH